MRQVQAGPQEPATYVARAEQRIYAPRERVFQALVNPDLARQYMFGAEVTSDWKEGSPISWKGEWEGSPYEDRGVVLRVEPGRLLQYSHFSPRPDIPDTPEYRHIVTITLADEAPFTRILLVQENNRTEEARDHSQMNWEEMLAGLKRVLEAGILRDFFNGYEDAFSKLDVRRSAGYFADTFISAGPKGAIAQGRAEFLRMADQVAEFYRRVGQTSARILSLRETQVNDEYSLVKVHWGASFRKTGDRLIEFDVSYLVQKTGPEPKILLFIAHQDEEQAMKELELL